MLRTKPVRQIAVQSLFALFTWTVFSFSVTQSSFALDQVNVHVSAGISPNTLLYRFTKEKGFYREEGLEVFLIQAGMLPGIQGLVGGSFHFSQILGQGAGTIPRGLQEKMVAFQRRSLKIEREVAPEQVYDFTMIRALNDELRRSK